MEESAYRDVFPLMCEVDILDAHDYREEVFDNLKFLFGAPFIL
jgi:hypothetical protein